MGTIPGLSTSRAVTSNTPAIQLAGHLPGLTELPHTLPEMLRQAARSESSRGIFHLEPGGGERCQTFADLLAEARAVCGGLLQLGLRPGDTAILLLDRSDEVLPAFWGCLFAGIRPAIAPIPPTFAGENRSLEQLCHVWKLLDAPLLVTNADWTQSVRLLSERLGVNQVRCADIAVLKTAPAEQNDVDGQPDETAFFCLTSGSTGVAKCIMLTHANIIERAHGANLLCGHSEHDVILNWLPFTHIGSISDWHLRCVLLGCRMIYADKDTVIAHPLRWLDLVDKYRVTHTWAPNFAYSLVSSALAAIRAGQKPAPTWDLSCVDAMLSAGESVSPNVIQSFLKELAPFGLAATAIRPAFGMAELGSGVTYFVGGPGRALRFHSAPRQLPSAGIEPGTFAEKDEKDTGTFTSLGPPIPGVSIRIVDEQQQVVAENTIGHLQIQGTAVSPGYFRNPEANSVFHADGWFDTGDLGFLADGELVLTGRAKESIIVRGVNYACSEIEETVSSVPGVEPSFTAACAVRRPGVEREELAVFFNTANVDGRLAEVLREVRHRLVRHIGVRPDFLLPVPKEAIPKTAIGKLQRGELSRRFAEGRYAAVLATVAELERRRGRGVDAGTEVQLAQGEIQQQLAAIWQEKLGIERVGIHDNLFDLGGDSLVLAGIHTELQQRFGPRITLVDMFNYPSIHSLALFLSGASGTGSPHASKHPEPRRNQPARMNGATASDIAVIGMACRFPGAPNIQQFWRNLSDGVESMQFFTLEESLSAGIDPKLLQNPDYVKVSSVLPDIEWFDAKFFGITARDARLMDPQQRVLLECAWETFEVAGYDPRAYPGSVGVYAGAVMNTYLLNNIYPARAFQSPHDRSEVLTLDSMGGFRVMIANDKDYLPTRISYKLNLRGPSVNVQTACSTALVAIHMAAQAVRSGECDMALAGGVSIKVPQEAGYLYLDEMIVSPDGHCRAFDASAKGTVFGNGGGLVLLKRLDEAIADGDHIFAVIKGSAINNDGSGKVGYMAPSQEGMAAAVSAALERAGVDPRSIGFVEAHGTGTALGDPIELGAITQAFRTQTPDAAYCAVGSVKSNIGHLQAASGVAGFIKAALALYHKRIPATLHFETPNPRIDFEHSPFYVNTQLQEWSRTEEPLRAGVNSLGVGGTNAHVVLEEAPVQPANAPVDGPVEPSLHLLPISARTPKALRTLVARYGEALPQFDDAELANVCFTAATGRAHFAERHAAIGSSIADMRRSLAKSLVSGTNGRQSTSHETGGTRVGFLFSGLGSQYVGMARRLYERQPCFREALLQCAELTANELPQPLLDFFHHLPADPSILDRSEIAEPALFAIGYGLAEMWREWGIQPSAVIGHGVGEYTAAVVAGAMSLEDGLRLVAARARLNQQAPQRDRLLAVRADEAQLRELLKDVAGLSIAAVNGRDQVVVSGGHDALDRLSRELKVRRIASRKLQYSRRCNLAPTDPLVLAFREVVEQLSISMPKTPLISNLTGRAATVEITTADYWCRQLFEPIRFADGVRALAEACDRFLELGPRQMLFPIARRTLREDPRFQSPGCWLGSLRPESDVWNEVLRALAELYKAGFDVDWHAFHKDAGRRRVVLPTYPFQRKRFWIDRPAEHTSAARSRKTRSGAS